MTTINVVHAGDAGAFNAILFPEQSPMVDQYIQNQLNNFSTTLTDIGRQFVETSRALYDKVNDSNAVRLAKAAVRMAKGMFHPNAIIPLETVEDLRAAQPMMQRYIMAEPMLREQFHKQLVDGFADTYADIDPGLIGVHHYDYRRVMNGVVQDTTEVDSEDNVVHGWVSMNFYEDLRGEDRELDFTEQHSILRTWDVVRMAMAAGRDPTDPFSVT
jgi:hypothetical protein